MVSTARQPLTLFFPQPNITASHAIPTCLPCLASVWKRAGGGRRYSSYRDGLRSEDTMNDPLAWYPTPSSRARILYNFWVRTIWQACGCKEARARVARIGASSASLSRLCFSVPPPPPARALNTPARPHRTRTHIVNELGVVRTDRPWTSPSPHPSTHTLSHSHTNRPSRHDETASHSPTDPALLNDCDSN